MFYVTEYIEYPIFEPAEGGYYYAGAYGNVLNSYTTRKKALRKMNKLRKSLKKDPCVDASKGRLWSMYDGTRFGCKSEYIGEGFWYALETSPLVDEKGYEPYC
jgi:hypothetical protein